MELSSAAAHHSWLHDRTPQSAQPRSTEQTVRAAATHTSAPAAQSAGVIVELSSVRAEAVVAALEPASSVGLSPVQGPDLPQESQALRAFESQSSAPAASEGTPSSDERASRRRTMVRQASLIGLSSLIRSASSTNGAPRVDPDLGSASMGSPEVTLAKARRIQNVAMMADPSGQLAHEAREMEHAARNRVERKAAEKLEALDRAASAVQARVRSTYILGSGVII